MRKVTKKQVHRRINPFPDRELVKMNKGENSIEFQMRKVMQLTGHHTPEPVNDSATSVWADTPLTQLHSPFVLPSHGEAA